VFLNVSLLFNRVTSDVSRRVPPTLRPRHREFQYFTRHLQYLQQTPTPTGSLTTTNALLSRLTTSSFIRIRPVPSSNNFSSTTKIPTWMTSVFTSLKYNDSANDSSKSVLDDFGQKWKYTTTQFELTSNFRAHTTPTTKA
jgi:hypothetical protein